MKEVTIPNNKPRSEIVEMLCRVGVPVSTAVEMADKIKNDFYMSAPHVYISSALKENTLEKTLCNIQATLNYINAAEYECGAVGIAAPSYSPKLISKCNGLYVCGGKISSNMLKEIRFAARKKIPITVFNRNIIGQVYKIAGRHAKIAAGKSGMLALPPECFERISDCYGCCTGKNTTC